MSTNFSMLLQIFFSIYTKRYHGKSCSKLIITAVSIVNGKRTYGRTDVLSGANDGIYITQMSYCYCPARHRQTCTITYLWILSPKSWKTSLLHSVLSAHSILSQVEEIKLDRTGLNWTGLWSIHLVPTRKMSRCHLLLHVWNPHNGK